MEISSKEQVSYAFQKISNSWNIILDFIDINTIFQYELACKYFRDRLSFYYETKKNLLKRISSKESKDSSELNESEKKNMIIKFKKNFLSNYYNLYATINISNIKFGLNEEKSQENEKKTINFAKN